MDQMAPPGPLGLLELEHPSPLGLHLMDSDKGVTFPEEGLDFKDIDLSDDVSPSCEEVFPENTLDLNSLLWTSGYSCGNHILSPLRGDRSSDSHGVLQSTRLGESPLREKAEEPVDCTLSWLFSPSPADLRRKPPAREGPNPRQDVPIADANNLGLLIALTECSSPVKNSDRTAAARTASALLAELLSCELPPSLFSPECSGELNPPGVSKEPSLPPLTEEGALPLPRGGEAPVSPETRDKGLSWEPGTDLPAVCNTTPDASPESRRLSHNTIPTDCIGSSPEAAYGSVPLLDSEVPDRESGLGLGSSVSHALPSSSPSEEPRRERGTLAALVKNPTSEHPGEEGDLSLHRPSPNCNTSTEAPSLRLHSDGDAPALGDPPGDRCERNGSRDLMESKRLSDVKHERVEEMALDQCLTTNELHDEEEAWGLKPPEGVHQDHHVPDLQSEQGDGDRSTDSNPLGLSDRHETDTFGFPVRELGSSSPEPGWTSGETAETISLSKMPMVSTQSQREEDVSPLKAVFDALDQDGDGFVRIEEFMAFAAAYGADQVKDLTKFLDPSGLGVISFEDFHRGISAISNGGPEPQLYDVHYSPGDGAVGCPEEYDEQNEVTDSAYLGSESTYSECETFTDEDTGALVPPEMHEDVETDSGIEATLHDPEDSSNRFSLNAELHSHSLVTVIGGEEEHFEDFGESNNTSELLLLETSVEDVEVGLCLLQTPEQLKGSSLLSPSAALPPDRFQSFLKEEALDFFCSQCHKQINRLDDLSTRLNVLEMSSSGKRLSSKKVARNLLQNSTMTLDTMSDLTRNILELADNDITDKVLLLERRVAELEKESEASGEQHTRLRQENLQLVHRANALEEQLKEQELHADEHLELEARRHKEALGKLERERGLELEYLHARLQQLEEESGELRSCVPCLRANIERLEEEKRKLQDESEDMTERLTEELEARRKMADKLSHERHQNQKEKESTQELIEDLRKQLEHLQLYKLEAEAKRGRSPSAGLQEYQTRTREAELEQEIKRLKQDNRSLKEQNDELNGQIINLSIQGAKSLLSASSFSDSLAAEISSVSRGELMEAVHKQEDINYRLQDYIDKIIVAIMESNPSILEVK